MKVFDKNCSPHTSISVIVAARNEEENIGRLLYALESQNYPEELFEIIVINDHSDDATEKVVKEFRRVRLINLDIEGINAYKKKAVETGVAQAKNELIACTDADCVPGPDWLKSLDCFYQNNKTKLVSGPVLINGPVSMVQKFEAVDFMMLQGITAGALASGLHSMSNAANLAYPKTVFQDLGGYKDNQHRASGDDMFLVQALRKKDPSQVQYLKNRDAIIETNPQENLASFIQQRIRWASKASDYSEPAIFIAMWIVFLANLALAILLLASIGNSHVFFVLFLPALALKVLVELPLFISVCIFFRRLRLLPWFIFFQPMHIFYTVLAAVLGRFRSYSWKGRRVS